MGTIYLCIVIFLLCLAVFDLFVGVSNDAVNFLQSAIGAKVAKFRMVLIIASCGVVLGAIMSSGMMDIARHGIMSPDHFTFEEVMTRMRSAKRSRRRVYRTRSMKATVLSMDRSSISMYRTLWDVPGSAAPSRWICSCRNVSM